MILLTKKRRMFWSRIRAYLSKTWINRCAGVTSVTNTFNPVSNKRFVCQTELHVSFYSDASIWAPFGKNWNNKKSEISTLFKPSVLPWANFWLFLTSPVQNFNLLNGTFLRFLRGNFFNHCKDFSVNMLRRSIQQHKKFSVTAAKAAGKKLNLIFRKFLKCLKFLVGGSLCKFFSHSAFIMKTSHIWIPCIIFFQTCLILEHRFSWKFLTPFSWKSVF